MSFFKDTGLEDADCALRTEAEDTLTKAKQSFRSNMKIARRMMITSLSSAFHEFKIVYNALWTSAANELLPNIGVKGVSGMLLVLHIGSSEITLQSGVSLCKSPFSAI